MKGKSGYRMKKQGSIKVAGSPSFEIRPVEHDPSPTPEERAAIKPAWERFVRETPEGRAIRRKGQAFQQRLKGV